MTAMFVQRVSRFVFYFSMIIREPALVLLVLGGVGVHNSHVCLAFPLFSEQMGKHHGALIEQTFFVYVKRAWFLAG